MPDAQGTFDVAVVGGGVVGCAVARRFALDGARTVLIERGPDILCGASKANSALLHTGFDAPAGSLELACIQAGYREYLDIRRRMNLPLLETGAMVAAWTDDEAGKLDAIEALARANGVDDVVRLTAAQARGREPRLAGHVRAALLVPGEHVIDPWSAPLAYLTQAVENGAVVLFDAEVGDGTFDGREWALRAGAHTVRARIVVNCAGLRGDLLDERMLGASDFSIIPRKGQFLVFDKSAAALLHAILLPVPNERTKGIVIARTVFGNLLVGPTAEDQTDRERAGVDRATLTMLREKAVELIPDLKDVPVTAAYAGLRPASERKEYRIAAHAGRRWITVGGIRSTGLTAALGIARHVAALCEETFGARFAPLPSVAWPAIPNLAEHDERDWQRADHGEIVCHCELVTRREIEAALSGRLPAGDIGGLKRRTRACMGQCQGFYCQARVAAIAGDRLAVPLAVERADG